MLQMSLRLKKRKIYQFIIVYHFVTLHYITVHIFLLSLWTQSIYHVTYYDPYLYYIGTNRLHLYSYHVYNLTMLHKTHSSLDRFVNIIYTTQFFPKTMWHSISEPYLGFFFCELRDYNFTIKSFFIPTMIFYHWNQI